MGEEVDNEESEKSEDSEDSVEDEITLDDFFRYQGFKDYADFVIVLKSIGTDIVSCLVQLLGSQDADNTRLLMTEDLYRGEFMPSNDLGDVLYQMKAFSFLLQTIVEEMGKTQ